MWLLLVTVILKAAITCPSVNFMLGAVVLFFTFTPWPNVDKSHITVLPAQRLLQIKAITTFY